MELYDERFRIQAWDMRSRIATLTKTWIARIVTSLLDRGHSSLGVNGVCSRLQLPKTVASNWKTIWETVCSIFTSLGWRFWCVGLWE
jgi:hypothetical protein